MKITTVNILVFLLPLIVITRKPDFGSFENKFVKDYTVLQIPQLELSYVSALQHIGTAASIKKQVYFFRAVNIGLAGYQFDLLSPAQKLDYQLMAYESKLNLERLALEQQYTGNNPADISTGGIITIPNGKAWYAYLLKRWLSDDVTPDQAFAFGIKEIKRVQGHIERIRSETGMSRNDFYKHLNEPSFFTSDLKLVQRSFEHTKGIIYSHLHLLFSQTKIAPLKIAKGASKQLAQTPGYYDDNTFYYNLFDKPYNKRQFDWLFMHEGVPGHHYQASIIAQTETSAVQQLFFYPGFAEGWGAYAEELGKPLGVYKTPYDELGKWEWDIVRSVRVPLDVGLNYYGWTDAQALAFWKKNIRDQDDIAMREISRMRRWPAQVITYKYGALQLIEWKDALQKKQGKNFDIKNFHNRVLDHGSLPLFIVKENVFEGS